MSGKGITSTQPTIAQVQDFLQAELEEGLSTNFLCRQVAAISSSLLTGLGPEISTYPHIQHFIRGVALINSPVVHRFPNWDLHIVLNSLTVLTAPLSC